MLLRKLGYEILVAANGREALNLLETEARRGRAYEVQCILMDASMDVMDGMEATRVIRAQQLPSRTRPFIIAQTVSVHTRLISCLCVSVRSTSHSFACCLFVSLQANVTEEYRAKCLESGMDLFTVKPVSATASQSSSRRGVRCDSEPVSHACLPLRAVALWWQVNIDELIRVLKIASTEHKKLYASPMTLAGPAASPPPALPLAASSAPPPAASTAPAGAPTSHAQPDAASAPPL